MDIELVKASLIRLRERRAVIPGMRDYKPQKGGAKKASTASALPGFDLTSFVERLNKSSSKPVEEEKKGGE